MDSFKEMQKELADKHGILAKSVYRNLSAAVLVETALKTEECELTGTGALSVKTGKYTGRSPKDRYIVCESNPLNINWGKDNLHLSPLQFDNIYKKITQYLCRKDLYVFDGFACAEKNYRVNTRVINEYASQNLFMQNMLIRPLSEELNGFKEDFTIIAAPGLNLDFAGLNINSEAAIILNLDKNIVLIAGSKYSGEMKKSVFSLMNYLLPLKGVLSMHCSANMGTGGETALFFGLSGTGKTTLSADPKRRLIGDDEHGWSDQGVFNIEGGCYAKCVNLSKENEPQIYDAIKFGAVAENVVINNKTRKPDYADQSLTENTRVCYPVDFIPGCVLSGKGGHPDTVIFLSADAFGVLPPVSKLTKEQAMYYFVSGYTAKVAGTERGVTEPSATFSTCFGSPFLPLRSEVYAKLLGEKIEKHGASVYLINTGWTGGKYGAGKRMSIAVTRAIVSAAVEGRLNNIQYETEPFFGLSIPKEIEGVDNNLLNPKNMWADKKEYDLTAKKLAGLFEENFKQYKTMPAEIVGAGPKA